MQKKPWSKRVMTAMFITAKTCKQPKCPSMREWINYDIVIKWNAIYYLKYIYSKDTNKFQTIMLKRKNEKKQVAA